MTHNTTHLCTPQRVLYNWLSSCAFSFFISSKSAVIFSRLAATFLLVSLSILLWTGGQLNSARAGGHLTSSSRSLSSLLIWLLSLMASTSWSQFCRWGWGGGVESCHHWYPYPSTPPSSHPSHPSYPSLIPPLPPLPLFTNLPQTG